jgi:Protein of unknown function (DUF3040)
MALSMDEQRMLAEIERRLTAEDPGLATKLASFRRPGRAGGLRSTRGRMVGTLCTIFLLAVIGLTVYAMIPFRAHGSKSPPSKVTASSQSVTASHDQIGPASASAAQP